MSIVRIRRKIFFLILFIPFWIFSQNSEWYVFTNEDIGITNTGISCFAEDQDGNIWIGTFGSELIKYDGSNWTIYDTLKSLLPEVDIWTISVDSMNNKWIGTYGSEGGLVKFDEIDWTVYSLAEYGIEGTSIFDIEIDKEGNLWMGTYWDGLVKYDGIDFIIYNNATSGLDQNMEEINSLAIDDSGHIWIGSDAVGVAKFDGVSEWVHYYNSDNTVDFAVYSIEIDNEGNVWFGGVWFISQFDCDSEWTQYDYADDGSWYTDIIIDSNKTIWFASWRKGFLKLDYSNGEVWNKYTPYGYTELEDEGSWAAFKDSKGNYWIGYNNGYIAVYNPDGITSTREIKSNIPSNYSLSQNYPNPFNPSTTIKYFIPENMKGERSNVSLKVFDVLGKEVATLVDKGQGSGNYEVQFNASSLTSGIYFYKLLSGSFVESKKMILIK